VIDLLGELVEDYLPLPTYAPSSPARLVSRKTCIRLIQKSFKGFDIVLATWYASVASCRTTTCARQVCIASCLNISSEQPSCACRRHFKDYSFGSKGFRSAQHVMGAVSQQSPQAIISLHASRSDGLHTFLFVNQILREERKEFAVTNWLVALSILSTLQFCRYYLVAGYM
jgi:hypothetical protein